MCQRLKANNIFTVKHGAHSESMNIVKNAFDKRMHFKMYLLSVVESTIYKCYSK